MVFSFSKLSAVIISSSVFLGAAALGSEYVPGQVIVKFKDGALRSQLYDAVGVRKVRRFSFPVGQIRGMEHLILNPGVKVEDALSAFRRESSVEWAQPNFILHSLPTGPARSLPGKETARALTPACWFLCAPAARPDLQAAPVDVSPPVADPDLDKSYGLIKSGAVAAWDIFKGSQSILVADIDTGIDYNHEDLAFNVWRNPAPGAQQDVVGFDFVHDDGLPFDDNEHGTHTAGTIGAVGGNGIGISGVAQRVSIMAVKFLDSNGTGETTGAISAINYAVAHGAKILNNSWGGPSYEPNDALQAAVENARASDVLFIAAAGNASTDNDQTKYPVIPASYKNDNMIAVAATDKDDNLTSYSDYGATSVQIAAPGDEVYSTVPNNEYKLDSGTSMACPHVTGAAALVWGMHPTWTYLQVKAALLGSVDVLDSLQGKVLSGGRLNVAKALTFEQPAAPAPAPGAP